MTALPTKICKGCRKPLVWAKTPAGSRVALDPRPAVYLVINADAAAPEAKRLEGAMVIHICPNAKETPADAPGEIPAE